MDDRVDRRFAELETRTRDVKPPAGFEARILDRLRKRAPNTWDLAWVACKRFAPVALCAAVVALSLAVWEDRRFEDAVTRATDGVVDVEVAP